MGKLLRSVTSETGLSLMRVYETRRPGGRRIRIERPDGTVLYDTDDCFDLGNAIHTAEEWVSSYNGEL